LGFIEEGGMEPVSEAMVFSPWTPGAFSLAIYALMVFGVVGILLFLAGGLGERRPNPEKGGPFESGILPTGSAPFRYPVLFYVVALVFLLFDVEAAFLFSWAVAFDRLGWAGWFEITLFVGVLLASLFYLWKKGGLQWGPTLQRK
jgi:NADH-quinone oxidoreductase subunit A